MSGYYRITKLKTYISSLRNVKNFNKLNENLTKEIDKICSKGSSIKDTTGNIQKFKELNKLLSKEFSKPNAVFNQTKTTVENSCKALYAVQDKKEQNTKKTFTLKHLKKEAEKLRKNLSWNPILARNISLGTAGLSLAPDVNTATKAAYTIFDTIDGIPQKAQKLQSDIQDLSKSASKEDFFIRPDTAFSEQISSVLFDQNSEYFVVKTGKYVEDSVSILANKISASDITEAIPEPPPVPDLAAEALSKLNALGEPTFESLGLGGWTPVGIVQHCMEYLHVTLGIDWWLAIMLGTLVIRILIFPLVIMAQRNAAKMNNYMPQMQSIQMKMTEARQTGDALNAARYSQELMVFMNEKGLNPLKNVIVPLAQAPIFISFFMGLRQMANVPVDSLRHGGIWWFTDLTLPDQYFLLPCITSLTLWLTIEIGTDSARVSAQNAVMVKYMLRAIPLVILPFTLNFPGVMLCYWVSSNFISMGQVAFLRIPAVREYFNIEQLKTITPDMLPSQPKGFTEGLKDSWTNIKITKELEERRRLDEMQFKRAGQGPIQKTFKYDPTKQASFGAKK